MYPIYVISNGDFFREALNATVTLLDTSTFSSAMSIAVMFAISMTAIQYIRTKDLLGLAKFFGLYLAVSSMLLIPKMDVQIIDISDPGRADLTVDNVPVGLGFPAYIITSVSYALTETMDDIFAMPRERSYSQTGMLFGSKLFRLGADVSLDPATQNLVNTYIRSCVIGDMLINHKYSVNDLQNNSNIWGLISSNPSPVRGMFINDVYHTCKDATPIIKEKVTGSSNSLFARLAQKANVNPLIFKTIFANSVNYYTGMSQGATQILNQNLWINATKRGMASYFAQNGDTAALSNFQDTTNMMKMRLSWSSLGHMALYTLPLTQAVFLAVMLCLFPIIVLLCLIPSLGHKVFLNWIYSILWLSSWPILFAIFNLAMNFYLYSNVSPMANGGLTLSNLNPLAQEHSDVSGIAGYLALSIPYIAVGIVKGMAGTFNVAANYLGSVAHSVAGGTAAQVAEGNFSLGNTSLANATANNLSMNKHDSNYTNMHGMATEQLATGATVTHTESGYDVYNVSPAMSHLAVTPRLGQMLSTQLSHSASQSEANVQHDQTSLGQTISSLASTAESLSHNQSATHSYGEGSSMGMNTQQSEAFHRADSIVSNWAKEHGYSHGHAWRAFAQASIDAKAGLGLFGNRVDVKGSAGGSADINSSTTHGNTARISSEEQQRFNHDMQIATSASHNIHTEAGHSDSNSLGAQLSAQYNQAHQEAHTLSSDYNKSQNLQNMASYAEHHSSSIDANYSQEFVGFAQGYLGDRARGVFANPNTATNMALLQGAAEQFVAQKVRPAFEQDYANNTQGINPEGMHNEQVSQLSENGIQSDYIKHSASIQGAGVDTRYDSRKEKSIAGQANKTLLDNKQQTGSDGQNTLDSANKNKADIQEGLGERHSKSLSELRKEAEQQKDLGKHAKKSDEEWPGWT